MTMAILNHEGLGVLLDVKYLGPIFEGASAILSEAHVSWSDIASLARHGGHQFIVWYCKGGVENFFGATANSEDEAIRMIAGADKALRAIFMDATGFDSRARHGNRDGWIGGQKHDGQSDATPWVLLVRPDLRARIQRELGVKVH